jgi:hypothetical protein
MPMAQTKVRANGEPHGLQWDFRGTQVIKADPVYCVGASPSLSEKA